MSISFNQMPSVILTPGVYVEFDKTQAIRGLVVKPYRMLVIGQRFSTGTVPAGVPTRISRAEQATGYFGRGSMLERMIKKLKLNNGFTELWAIALDDDAGGVAALGGLGFTGPATAAGTVSLYVAGQAVKVAVTAGQTATQVAAAVAAAITANADLPVTATSAAGNVTITARHKGEVANSIDLRFNYYTGEAFPAGIVGSVSIAMLGGTVNPSLATTITAMSDDWYDIIAIPYTDAANLALLKTELDGRWGPVRSIEGHAITAASGTFSALTAVGATLNDPHLTMLGIQKSPSPPYEWAAAVAGIAAYFGNIDPARPLQTLAIAGVLPPVGDDLFIWSEREQLLASGVATFTTDPDGTNRVERLVTTYKTNEFGAADPSYRDIETLLTLGFLRFSLRTLFRQKYPRHKVANDGTRFGPGQVVVTPKTVKAECFNWFRLCEELGLVENFDQFKADIIVERNVTDPNRIDIYLPPDLVNQLRVTAAQIAFRL